VILALSAVLYGCSAAAYIADLYGVEARLLGWCLAGAGALGGVLAVLLGGLPLQGAALPVEALTWLIVTNFLIADGFLGLRAAGALLMPVVTLASLIAIALRSAGTGAPLSGLHLFAALFAYGAFALAFAASGLYLIQERALRRRAFDGPYRRVPSLAWLDRAAHGLILYGFPMLCLALLTETLRGPRAVALGTGAVCALAGAYLLARALGRLRGRGAARLAVWGFTGVLVNLLLLSLLVNSV
jgi:ABC-type uncharacterized transport system permease subunit